ncbi:MAG TPA: heavy metal sensor histidine kinase, partial [Chloroflexota bacterium]|nr:heavy metal sensor histidine kinase [Chloroflexota bacterium]
TLWYVALLTIILVVFSAFLVLNLSRNLHAELDRSLVGEAQRSMATLDVQDGQPSLNEETEAPGTGVAITIYDRGGTIPMAGLRHPPFVLPATLLAEAAQGHQLFATAQGTDGAKWRVLAMPAVDNGQIIGVLVVARTEQEVTTALDQLVLLIAVAIPLTLLLAVVGGIFLAGRALNPIARITRTAEHLGAEDLSYRLSFAHADDEVGRLAATFDRMLDRLDRAFQRQRTFTADASHELRTPLALLISQADLALERSRTAAEYRRALSSIRDDAQAMHRLLSDLLTLARADAHQEELDCEPLDLRDLANEVVTALDPLARSRQLTLKFDSTDSVVVRGDQTRLAQLLVNLVDNGLKYTPAGGIVSIAVRRQGDYAHVEVTDTGVGIPPEHLPHLFERFYRVDKARSRATGGTGLGLAISRWIAETHGGTISVASEPGRGSTFTVTLPVLTASDAYQSADTAESTVRRARGTNGTG